MNFFISLSFIFFYVLPNSFLKINGINIYYFNRSFYNFIGLCYLLFILRKSNFKLKIREYILLIIVFFRVFFLKDYESISLLLLILIDRIRIKKIKLRKIFILIFITTIMYSIYFKHLTGRPIATAVGEINISGFSILILYLISGLQRYKILKKVFLFLGFFTFSRNFILAILGNYFIKFSKVKFFFVKLFKNFFIVSIFSLGLMIGVAKIFEGYVENNGVNIYQKGIKRYTTLIDNSNLYRFQANINVIKFYKMYPLKLVTGERLERFRRNVEIHKDKYGVTKVRSPHNFYYKYLLKYGIFSFYLFWYISKIIGKVTEEKIEFFIPYYIYSLILGVGFYDFYLLILKYLLESNQKRKVKNGKDKI